MLLLGKIKNPPFLTKCKIYLFFPNPFLREIISKISIINKSKINVRYIAWNQFHYSVWVKSFILQIVIPEQAAK